MLSRDVDFACNNLSSMTGLLTGGKLRCDDHARRGAASGHSATCELRRRWKR